MSIKLASKKVPDRLQRRFKRTYLEVTSVSTAFVFQKDRVTVFCFSVFVFCHCSRLCACVCTCAPGRLLHRCACAP